MNDWIEKMENIDKLLNQIEFGRWYHDAATTPYDVCIWNMDVDEEHEWIANIGGRTWAKVDMGEGMDSERDIADFIVKCKNELNWIFEKARQKINNKDFKIQRLGYMNTVLNEMKLWYFEKYGASSDEYNSDVECESEFGEDDECSSIWVGPPLNRKFFGNLDEDTENVREGLIDVGKKIHAEFALCCFRDMPEIIDGIQGIIFDEEENEEV